MATSSQRATRSVAGSQDLSNSQFERILSNAARLAIVGMGFIVLLVALRAGQVILAPVALAMVVGLMFGPVADFVERRGVPPALSAGVVVILLLVIIFGGIALFAVPLSEWVARGPLIWEKLRNELQNWQEPLQALTALQDQIKTVLGGGSAMPVTVEDGSAVTSVAMIFPAIGAQVLIFLASLYFFVATRDHMRISVLSLCVTRRMRWRTAHVFQDVEAKVSRFLLSVTFINLCVGTAVSIAMWAIGMPSPILWGAMAAVFNYIPYVGQAVMTVVLLAVGLGTQTGLGPILLPLGCYLAINFVEGQVITPHLLGRTMTLNPFMIFLSITFWIWAWGPVGGLVAVPSLLVLQSLTTHILPSREVAPRRPVRRTAKMSDKDVMLANAARVVRERAEDEKRQAAEKEARKDKLVPPAGTAPDGVPAPE